MDNGKAPALRRVMRAGDYFTLAFGSIVGVGWMILMEDWLKRGGPAGAMLGFLLGGVALIPVVWVYGRLAARLPEAGTEIAYAAAVYPAGMSFATGWAMVFANAIVCPFEAVAIGRVAGYAVPALNSVELYQVAGYPVYLPHLLLGLGTAAAITAINYRGITQSALLQNVTTCGLLAIFALFATLGLVRGSVENLPPYFAGSGSQGILLSIIAVLPIVPYYMMGFETIPKCSEEAAGGFAPARFVRVMFLALGVATVFYVTVIAVVALLQPWQQLDMQFATVVAFERAFGWPWLVQLIMLGALLSLIKVFNGNFLASTRLLYALGQRGLLGGGLGRVHRRYQTPYVAIALVGTLTVAGMLLGRAILVPVSEVGSLCGAGVWLTTALAYLRGAAGTPASGGDVAGGAAVVVSYGLLLIAAWEFGPYHWLALALWSGLGLALWLSRPR